MDPGLETTVSVRQRSGVGSCQNLALQGQGGMTREKKLPGDSEREPRQAASFRTGVLRGDCLCSLGQLPKEGCFLPKAKLGPGIQAEHSGSSRYGCSSDSVSLD